MSKAETVVDMSPEAIARRLRTVSELYDFTRTLKNVEWLGKAKDLRRTQEEAKRAKDRDALLMDAPRPSGPTRRSAPRDWTSPSGLPGSRTNGKG